ncbi:TolC family protein [Reinekea marinisedimentorum]|uniref:Outer membrane efflux protein n=1 Tax=Reinekea marinisedimentorum TaxID=230495 RepID=A0A4R3HU61_9GAMM|nr:TolC family protein [Reinekea marinisedimentorum]TCS35691.1 outer membrane efflux protein [Reinekea marinisedimentorum]
MRSLKAYGALAVLLLPFAASALAKDLPALALDEQWNIVQSDSYDMVKARNDLRLAADELDIKWWDDADIKLTGSSTYDLDAEDNSYAVTLDASVPLNSKLEIGSSVSTDDEAEIYSTYKPFALSDITPEMVEAYELAVLALEYTRQDLKTELESAFLNLVTAQQEYEIAELDLAIAEQVLESVRGAFELGESSSSDLIDAQKDVIDAREDLYETLVSVAEAEQSYQELLGEDVNTDVSNLVNFQGLQALVEERQKSIESLQDADAKSEELRTLAVELISLKAQLANIYDYDPDLTLGANYDIDDEVFTASLSVNLSPAQFGKEDQADAAMEVTLKEMELADEKLSLAVQLNVNRKKVEIAEAALESNLSALEQEEINTREAEYLFEVGERTALELSQQRLALQLSQVTTFVSLVEVYQAQSDLAELF